MLQVLPRYRVLPFEAVDFKLLEPRKEQLPELEFLADPGAGHEAVGSGFTMWEHRAVGEPRPIFCGGAFERHCEYATLWAVFGQAAPRLPIYLTKRVRAFVRELPHRRVDTTISPKVPGAAGWARLLGLRPEATLADYFPDGTPVTIYTRKPE